MRSSFHKFLPSLLWLHLLPKVQEGRDWGTAGCIQGQIASTGESGISGGYRLVIHHVLMGSQVLPRLCISILVLLLLREN